MMHFTLSTTITSLLAASISVPSVLAAALPGQGDLVRRQNTSITPSCSATSPQTYTIVTGDTLSIIADKYSVGFCNIASANNITDPNLIFPGQVLTIPTGICTIDNTSCATPPRTANCTVGGPNAYLVRSSDTFTGIAANFNVTNASLYAANHAVGDPDSIFVGQILNITVCPKTKCTAATYVVKSGDTFAGLASTHGVSVGQVLASNIAVDPTKLAIGQQIILPQRCKSI